MFLVIENHFGGAFEGGDLAIVCKFWSILCKIRRTVGSALAGLSNNGNPSSVIIGINYCYCILISSVIIGGINGIILEGLTRSPVTVSPLLNATRSLKPLDTPLRSLHTVVVLCAAVCEKEGQSHTSQSTAPKPTHRTTCT